MGAVLRRDFLPDVVGAVLRRFFLPDVVGAIDIIKSRRRLAERKKCGRHLGLVILLLRNSRTDKMPEH